MSCETDTAEMLRRTGYRLTPQRMLVVSTLRHAKGHLTATEILAQVKEKYRYVDVSTVYRTMTVLKELRLVNETNLGSGDAKFEWTAETPHHHLICNSCGDIDQLDHAFLARLGLDLLAQNGFHADLDHFAIFGLCRSCADTQSLRVQSPAAGSIRAS